MGILRDIYNKTFSKNGVDNMSNLDVIKEIRVNHLDQYSSWALYDIDDARLKEYLDQDNKIPNENLAFPAKYQNDEALANKINTDAMFYGLNVAARNIKTDSGDWANFHDTRDKSKDLGILFDLYNTKFRGAYMSDVFKYLPETESKNVKVSQLVKDMQADGDNDAKKSLRLLQKEIDIIKPKIIVLYGAPSQDAFDKMIKANLLTLPEGVKIVGRHHYSMGERYDEKATKLVKESKEIYGE